MINRVQLINGPLNSNNWDYMLYLYTNQRLPIHASELCFVKNKTKKLLQ